MNKLSSVSEISEPPLLMVSLAVISLVFNLCFPQYSAHASTEKIRFVREENVIALDDLKKEAESRKLVLSTAILPEESYSELKLEPKAVAKAKPKVAAAPQAVSISTGTNSKWVTVTAYSSTVDQCDSNPFITASGKHVRDGIIATNALAFGTKVMFPSVYGNKVFTVEDRMNRRYSDRADIWFETREEAKLFGIKKLEMVIIS